MPVWQCPGHWVNGKPYLLFMWKSGAGPSPDQPWPPGAQLRFESCSSAAAPYTAAARPAVSLRISRNAGFFRAGPFECLAFVADGCPGGAPGFVQTVDIEPAAA